MFGTQFLGLLPLLLMCLTPDSSSGLPSVIKIGGLFDSSQIDNINEKVFLKAIAKVNELDLLEGTKLEGLTRKVPEHQSFPVEKSVCELISAGCVAIFGPRSPVTTPIVESVTDTKEIPHISTRWTNRASRSNCAVNLYPDADVLASVLVDVVRAEGWTHFTIVYYDDDGLYRVKKLLEMYEWKGHTIVLRKLPDDGNFRPVLRGIKVSKQTFILIDVPTDILHEVLKQAQQIGLMSSEQNFIINNLDMHTVDMEPFKYSGTNISGIRMINTDNPLFRKTIEEWSDGELDITPDTVPLETVLIYDGVFLLAQSLLNVPIEQDPSSVRVARQDDAGAENDGINEDGSPRNEPPEGGGTGDEPGWSSGIPREVSGSTEPVTCENDIAWPHGHSIINDIKISKMPQALSGNLWFDNEGLRSNFQLELIQLTERAMVGTGKWSTKEHVKSYKHQEQEYSLRNMTLRVVIALTPPYGMVKDSFVTLRGNDRYEGYSVDLIQELSQLMGFNYTLEVQVDKKQGNYDNNTKRWNGMIGKILYGEADLAITDLTITGSREEVVDFTMPFMNLGISILYKKPKNKPPELFSFLSPFSVGVWMYVIGAYIGVSMLLFVMARISPYEWNNPYPCIQEPEELENQFSVSNSFWFTIGSLMQQGSEIAPIAVSTRMVAGIWWFFTLIMVSSYTANLAAFLTTQTPDSPFSDVEGLQAQSAIKYGAKAEGSTQNFFKESKNEIYQRMWNYMEANYQDVMLKTNEEGVNRVNNNEDYAFLMESSSIQYEVERKCNLTQVGDLLDSKGYGIAMQKNKWFRNKLNYYVLTLQEKGKLEALKNKWWKEKGAGTCQAEETATSETTGLTLANVGGVFVVLVSGIFFSIFVAFGEMIFNLWQVSVEKKVSFSEEFRREWQFISKCQGSVKPVRKYGSSNDGSGGSGAGSAVGSDSEEAPPSIKPRPTKTQTPAVGSPLSSRTNLHMIEAAQQPSEGTWPRSRKTSRAAIPVPTPSPQNGAAGVAASRPKTRGGEGGGSRQSNEQKGGGGINGGSRNNVHLIGFESLGDTNDGGAAGVRGREKGKRQRRARNSNETDI
uniref:Glutamate receptor ionotropic, kainate 3 n=2 Tax=Cacopsylla melanoneura TaxID=428564 RepID=A0A8D9EDN7_9HEMI